MSFFSCAKNKEGLASSIEFYLLWPEHVVLWWLSLPRHERLRKDIKLKKVRGWSEMENRLTGAKIIFHYTLKPHTTNGIFLGVFVPSLWLPAHCGGSLWIHLAVFSSSSSWSGICEMSI